ncbi:DUF4012 domain-containing protein [Candidatus Peregrinibacteria bacterium]|nr:DUF4012 domain-containing protein [Candidatus Peregrinibacteria bacterium]
MKKIFRDIEQKDEQIISLKKDENKSKPKGGLVLDCSKKPGRGKIGNEKSASKIKDISNSKEDDDVLFLQIGSEKQNKNKGIYESIKIAAIGIVILFLINIVNVYNNGLNLGNSIVASAVNGYETLLNAGGQAEGYDFNAAEVTFTKAKKSFDEALNSLSLLSNGQNSLYAHGITFSTVESILNAAKEISNAGENFSRGIANLQVLPSLFIAENMPQKIGLNNVERPSLTERIKDDFEYIELAINNLSNAELELNKVNDFILPGQLREKMVLAREKIEELNDLLFETRQKFPAVLDLLGDRYPHRYLVLLQNDTEARPTGGFIGSYIILDINDGYITKMDFHDIYELDNQLKENIEPPLDISLITDKWRMRDSNYSPDFAISAEKSAWFLQKQGGPSVDSIIAVNLSFITDLLALGGPMKIEGLEADLTAENFQLVISYIVESKLEGDENPKQVLSDIIPNFFNSILAEVDLGDFMQTTLQGINQKKVMFYSRKEGVQQLFEDLDLTPHVRSLNEKEDYLNVIVTSIGGNKSDKFINQNVSHSTFVQKNGAIIDEVTIERKHNWTEKDLEKWREILSEFGFNLNDGTIIDILGRGRNKAFVKIFVPAGSEIIEVKGIEEDMVISTHDEELNKHYFMFVTEVENGKYDTVSIKYKLPFKLSINPADSYKLFVQKQPSVNATFFNKTMLFEPGLEGLKTYPEMFSPHSDLSLKYSAPLKRDIYLSTLVSN